MLMTPEMFGRWDDRRKDQSAGIHAAFLSFRTQIAYDQRVRLEQP